MLNISRITKQFTTVTAGSLLAATAAMAGEVTASKEVVKPEPAPVQDWVTGDAGVAVVSKYFSRGIQLENQGFIAQPYADLYFKLYQGDGFINSVTLNLSIWSSLNSHKQGTVSGAPSTTDTWYEFDYTPGIAVTFAKNFTATLSYFEFDSPADNFSTARSINLNLAYDDSALLGAFALHPHATVLAELDAPGFAGLGAGGWYYEIGVAPSHTFGAVTVSVPLTVGLGDDNFYAGNTYGYFSGGVTAAVPLSFIPAAYGSWTATAGATYYNLGDTTKAADVGESNDYVVSGAIGVTF